ncbi:hypothetical protein OAN24_00345 [Pseudodesulfovibrio sp.]|nr:hypothetical protein [Pseudodesulfovibrio sp.]
MPYTYTFTDKQNYLLCVTSGEVKDVASLIAFSETIIVEARKLKRCRLLIDDRSLIVDLSPLDVTTFGNHLETVDFAILGLRIAVVYSPTNTEISRLFETILTNRSVAFQTFKEINEAEEWLTSSTCKTNMIGDNNKQSKFTYTFEKTEQYLLVETIGTPSSFEETAAYAVRVFEEVDGAGVKRLVVDESRAFINFDHHVTLVKAELSESDRRKRLEIRTAVVCAPHSLDLYKLLQSHATDARNFNSKVFDSREDAIQWLLHGEDTVTL